MTTLLTLDLYGNVLLDGVATGQQLGDFLVRNPQYATAVNRLLADTLAAARHDLSSALASATAAAERAAMTTRLQDEIISTLRAQLPESSVVLSPDKTLPAPLPPQLPADVVTVVPAKSLIARIFGRVN